MHTPAIGDILEFGLHDYLQPIQEQLIERLNRYIVEAFSRDALPRVRQRFLERLL